MTTILGHGPGRANAILAIAPLLLLSVWVSQAEAACPTPDKALVKIPLQDVEGFVQRSFGSKQFDCGVRAVELKAHAAAGKRDEAGVDERFALRNLAVKVSRSPEAATSWKLALLKAAASTLSAGQAPPDPKDVKFDVMMATKAGHVFREKPDYEGSLAALTLAIQIDQQLPQAGRTLRPYDSQWLLPESHQAYEYYGQILILAQISRNDPSLSFFRESLARLLHSGSVGWRDEDSFDVMVQRAEQLLALEVVLADVRACKGCIPGWQWKLAMTAGTAYYRMGEVEKGTPHIVRAMGIAREIESPDYRLNTYRSVLMDLLACKYDRRETLALMDEMSALAASSNTPIAKETRETLDRISVNYKLGWTADRVKKSPDQ